jgi:hypothetical protein
MVWTVMEAASGHNVPAALAGSAQLLATATPACGELLICINDLSTFDSSLLLSYFCVAGRR